MRRFLAIALSMTACVLLAGPVASAQLTKCQISYDLKGWSVFYKTSKGTGHITCTNGQSADVGLSAHGGGVTFGTFKVTGGNLPHCCFGRLLLLRHIETLLGVLDPMMCLLA